ncbi:MAG: PKD domain-containing protein [bacterium]
MTWTATNADASVVAGPDSANYVGVDNVQGNLYSFQYVAGSGITDLVQTGCAFDEDMCFVNLPAFNYYGGSYSSGYVSANGFLSFSGTGQSYAPSNVPSFWPNSAMIAPFWGDLCPGGASADPDDPSTGQVLVGSATLSPAAADDSTAYFMEFNHVSGYGEGGECTTKARCESITSTVYGSTFELKLIPNSDVFEFHLKCADAGDVKSQAVISCHPFVVGNAGPGGPGLIDAWAAGPCSADGWPNCPTGQNMECISKGWRFFQNGAEPACPATSPYPQCTGAVSTTVTINKGTSLAWSLDSNDPKRYSWVSNPSAACGGAGSLAGFMPTASPTYSPLYYYGGKSLTYTPPATYVGTCSFTYRLDDGYDNPTITVNVNIVDTTPPTPTACSGPATGVTGQTLAFSATGGDGTYAWTGGGSPATGSGASFSTSFSTAGVKSVVVTSNAQTGTCIVTISLPGAPSCTPASQFVALGLPATVNAAGGDGTFAWTGGDSPATGSGASFATTFSSVGTKSVVVTSATQTATCTVEVVDGACPFLNANFIFTAGHIEAGEPVSFSDVSKDGGGHVIKSWSWDFGDGYSSNLQSLSHTFLAAGQYKVRLGIVDDLPCTDIAEQTVDVTVTGQSEPPSTSEGGQTPGYAPPTVYAGEDQTAPEGAHIKLAASASGSTASFTYSWRQLAGPAMTLTFADTAEPEFTAPAVASPLEPLPLTFGVKVSDGTMESQEDTVQITIVTKNQHAPIAVAGKDITVAKGGTATLDARASSDPDGDALSYAWAQDGGDAIPGLPASGSTLTLAIPVGTTAAFVDVTLTATDGYYRAADTVRIWLQAAPAPASGFSAAPQADGSVRFTANAQAAEYIWDFGDTATAASTGASVSHKYTSPGTYTVQLRLGADATPVQQDVTPTVPQATPVAHVEPTGSGNAAWALWAGLAVGAVLFAGLFVWAIRHRNVR